VPALEPSEEAVAVCDLLLRLHKDKLVSLFDVCIAKALAALETGGLARDVGLSLVKWVEALSLATHPDVVCRSLCGMLLTLTPPALQVAINVIKLMVPMLGSRGLKLHMPPLAQGLAKCFGHTSAEVRKGCVFVYVELYKVLGDGLQPHLKGLSASQVKLVSVYIARAIPDASPAIGDS